MPHTSCTNCTSSTPWFQIVVLLKPDMVKAFCRRCNKYVDSRTHSHGNPIGNPLNPADRQHQRAGRRFSDGRF